MEVDARYAFRTELRATRTEQGLAGVSTTQLPFSRRTLESETDSGIIADHKFPSCEV